jgi:hypothetical protein
MPSDSPGSAPNTTYSEQAVGGSVGHHLAVVEDDDAVCAAFDVVEVVRGEHHADPVRFERLEHLSDEQAPFHVDASGRFVEKGDPWPTYQRQSQRQPLLLAARQRAPRGPSPAGETNLLE